MKKKILLSLSALALIISCSSNSEPTVDKPLTSNVPSADKTKREGTPLSEFNKGARTANGLPVALQESGAKEYPLNERLYSSTWYKSEQDEDDGVLETEEEFIFFDQNSSKSKRKYENGKLDDNDFYTVTLVKEVNTTQYGTEKNGKNACIVKVKEKGDDTEYEGYYMKDDRTVLYIVEGDSETEVEKELKKLIEAVQGGNDSNYKDEKYVLSTQAR